MFEALLNELLHPEPTAHLYANTDFTQLNWFEMQWVNWYLWIDNPILATGLMSFVLHEVCGCGDLLLNGSTIATYRLCILADVFLGSSSMLFRTSTDGNSSPSVYCARSFDYTLKFTSNSGKSTFAKGSMGMHKTRSPHTFHRRNPTGVHYLFVQQSHLNVSHRYGHSTQWQKPSACEHGKSPSRTGKPWRSKSQSSSSSKTSGITSPINPCTTVPSTNAFTRFITSTPHLLGWQQSTHILSKFLFSVWELLVDRCCIAS